MLLGCRGGRCILRKMLPLLCWRRWRSNGLAGHHLMSAVCVPQDFSLKGGFLNQKPWRKSQNSPLQEEVLPMHSYRPRKSIWQQAKDMPCSSANQNIPTSAWVALSKQTLLGNSKNTYTVLQFTLHMRFIFHNAASMEAMAWSKQLLKLAYFCLIHPTWKLWASAGEMHTQWPWHNTQLLALQMLPDGTWASRYGKSPSENSPSPQPCKQQGLQKNKHSCSCAHAAQCKPPCVTMSSPSGHDAQPMSDLNPQIWAGRGCIQGLGHSSCHMQPQPWKSWFSQTSAEMSEHTDLYLLQSTPHSQYTN